MSWDEPCPDCTIKDGSTVWCEKCLAENPYRTNLIEEKPKVGRETAIMESPFGLECPNCQIVLGSLVPCEDCLAQGVEAGPLNPKRDRRTVSVELGEFEIPETGPTPWTFSAPDRWLGGILITIGVMFVLYLLLALAMQPARTRPMPLTARAVAAPSPETNPANTANNSGKQLLQRGSRLISDGRFADGESLVHQAIDTFQREGSDNQLLAAAHYWLAVSHERQGASEEARRALERAQALDPDNPSYQVALVASRKQGSEQRRQQTLKETQALAARAISGIGEGHAPQAEEALRTVLQEYEMLGASPQLKAEAHAFLGAALAAQQKKTEARQEIQKAIQLDPQPRYQQGLEALDAATE